LGAGTGLGAATGLGAGAGFGAAGFGAATGFGAGFGFGAAIGLGAGFGFGAATGFGFGFATVVGDALGRAAVVGGTVGGAVTRSGMTTGAAGVTATADEFEPSRLTAISATKAPRTTVAPSTAKAACRRWNRSHHRKRPHDVMRFSAFPMDSTPYRPDRVDPVAHLHSLVHKARAHPA
jgi:hypothetical protein